MSIIEGNNPNPIPFARSIHPIVFDKETDAVSVMSCRSGAVLLSQGQCRDGCCDDYLCPDCGGSFRVEWPD